MSALTEQAFVELGNIGAIPVNTSQADVKWERARGLVEAAAMRVRQYIGLDDAAILGLSDDLQGCLAVVIAEIASVRLQFSAAPSTEGYTAEGYFASMILQPRFRRELDDLFRPLNGGSISIVLERDEDSSFFRPYDDFLTL